MRGMSDVDVNLGPARSAGLVVWSVRLGLVALSFTALWAARLADARFRETIASAFRFDARQWSATITPLVIAGALFAVAARFPFPRPRYAWGRLLLASIALVPALHQAFIVWSPQFDVHWPAVLITPRWFDDGSLPSACAVLAGVAIGCGFGARREGRVVA
jgi:hypothetical protein